VLVGLWSTIGLLNGGYEIVSRSLESRAIHARHSWHQPLPFSAYLLLGIVWFCSVVILIPAGAIGASELYGNGRGTRTRAAAFVAGLCVGVVCQYAAVSFASQSMGSPFARDDWLHDGRSWWALMCLCSIVMFAGVLRLLKPARVPRHA
jgi:hypothetical protein